MLKAIQNNPYRILGVFSNSPKKEQIANKGKMQAFLRVNKSMPFKLDLKGILPEIQRTQKLVDFADSELALFSGQIKHAQFWFINKTPIDDIAFNHLFDGNIESAIDFWKKSINLSSLQNLFVCYLIKEDYVAALNIAVSLYNQYTKELVSEIDDKATISANTLIQTVVDIITNEGFDLLLVSKSISDNTWQTIIEAKKVEPLISQLNSHVSEAKAAKNQGASARLIAGNKLKIATKPLLATLHRILPINDTRYQMIADKIAQEVLQCSIDYYNDTDDVDSPAKALPLCEYAMSIAVGTAAKQRCEQNHDVIKEAYDNMPPTEVASEAKEINELLIWYRKQKRTSEIGLELLQKAKQPLIIIKEKLGNKNDYYLEVSSLLGNAALSNVIDEVNEVQKEDKPDPLFEILGRSYSHNSLLDMLDQEDRRRKKAQNIKNAFRAAWRTILYIDLLDKTSEFKDKRFQPNRKALYSLINSVNGFDYPDDHYILKGCAHGVKADHKFFWTDTEHFEACTSKADYNKYLYHFPNGVHVDEAKQRITEIEERNKKTRKYILIAILIAIVLFIIIIASNARSSSSFRNTSPSNETNWYGNSMGFDNSTSFENNSRNSNNSYSNSDSYDYDESVEEDDEEEIEDDEEDYYDNENFDNDEF